MGPPALPRPLRTMPWFNEAAARGCGGSMASHHQRTRRTFNEAPNQVGERSVHEHFCVSSASAKGHKCQDADSRISAIRSVAAPPGGAVTASRRALTIHELILFCSAVAAVTTAA